MNKPRVWNGVAIYIGVIFLGFASGFTTCGMFNRALEPVSFLVVGLLIILLSYGWTLEYRKIKNPFIGALLLISYSAICALSYLVSAMVFYRLGTQLYSSIHNGAAHLCGLSPFGSVFIFGGLVIIQLVAFMIAGIVAKRDKKKDAKGKSA